MNKLLTELCGCLKVKPQYLELLRERDTSDIWRQFAIWLLVDEDDGVIRFTKPGTPQYHAIQQVAQLYIEDCKDRKRWKAAACDADAAWYAAAAAEAGYAAWSAAKAAAAAAVYAANASAEAAYYAPTAAYYAAQAAKAAGYAAWSAAADAWYALSGAYGVAADAAAYDERMTDKLIELINAAPIKEAP